MSSIPSMISNEVVFILEPKKDYSIDELLDIYIDYKLLHTMFGDEYYDLMMFVCESKIYSKTKDKPP